MTPTVLVVLVAKTARTFCYGFLGIVLPLYLAELRVSAAGIGLAVTLILAASAGLTWAVRYPAERWGGRAALLGLVALSAVAAVILLVARSPWMVVVAAMLGNVAVSTGETGPFLTIDQVALARAVAASQRTGVMSVYNLVGYAAAALGALAITAVPDPHGLFVVFLAGTAVQAVAYAGLPALTASRRAGPRGPLPSAPLIRRLAALFALDAFAGGFVLQSLVAYFLNARFGLALHTLGVIFAVTQVLTAMSLLVAAWLARRFGLLPTMVVSHLASNAILIAIAVAPVAWLAVALLFARNTLSQMDVPTRQAYLMVLVQDHEREAAATMTNLARTAAQAVTPTVTGWVMHAVALAAPFALGGTLKIVYDVLLWLSFRNVPLDER